MISSERKDLLNVLTLSYLIEKYKNDRVWQREKSSSYYLALGKLEGACTGFNLEFEESDDTLIVYTRCKRNLVVEVTL